MSKKAVRRSPGRPRIADYTVLVRLEEEDIGRLEAWMAKWKRDTGLQLGRGVAIRQCMRLWFAAKKIKAAP